MNEQLKKLYKTVILKNNSEPFHFIKREEASCVVEAYNQICGDRFKLFFELENGKISQLSFYGFGCAISKASTSVLVQKLDGKNLDEARGVLDSFFKVINEGNEGNEDFLAFAAAREFPGRMKCATLSWEEMDKFLK